MYLNLAHYVLVHFILQPCDTPRWQLTSLACEAVQKADVAEIRLSNGLAVGGLLHLDRLLHPRLLLYIRCGGQHQILHQKI